MLPLFVVFSLRTLAFGDVGLGDTVLSPWVISWMTITFGDMLGDHGSPGRYVIPFTFGERLGDLRSPRPTPSALGHLDLHWNVDYLRLVWI